MINQSIILNLVLSPPPFSSSYTDIIQLWIHRHSDRLTYNRTLPVDWICIIYEVVPPAPDKSVVYYIAGENWGPEHMCSHMYQHPNSEPCLDLIKQ